MRYIFELLTLAVVIVSAVWLYMAPGFESAIALLVGSSTLVAEVMLTSKGGVGETPVAFLLRPYIRCKRAKDLERERNTPVAKISFDTLFDLNSIHHEVAAWNIWDDVSPAGKIDIRHKINNGSWTTVKIVDGFFPKIWAEDVNLDNVPELLIQFHCGAHGQGLLIFKVDKWGKMNLFEEGEIYSNWSEINLERSGDIYTVVAKQRDYSSSGKTMGPIIERYEIEGCEVRRIK